MPRGKSQDCQPHSDFQLRAGCAVATYSRFPWKEEVDKKGKYVNTDWMLSTASLVPRESRDEQTWKITRWGCRDTVSTWDHRTPPFCVTHACLLRIWGVTVVENRWPWSPSTALHFSSLGPQIHLACLSVSPGWSYPVQTSQVMLLKPSDHASLKTNLLAQTKIWEQTYL